MTSITTEEIAALCRPKFNSAPTLYSKRGVNTVRPSSPLWVKRAAWLCRKHPRWSIRRGLFLQRPVDPTQLSWESFAPAAIHYTALRLL
jgi:hypothetical protein